MAQEEDYSDQPKRLRPAVGFEDFGEKRTPPFLTWLGAAIALGFLFISAASNYLFAASLAKNNLAIIYGAVGILATLANAYLPVRMLLAYDVRRWSVMLAALLLLPLCVAFSLVSAIGFASTIREAGTAEQAALAANYRLALTMLEEAEAKPRRQSTQEKRVQELRNQVIAYQNKGAMKQVDPQAAALEQLGIPNARYLVSLLFAMLVEVGAGLGLLLAFSDRR